MANAETNCKIHKQTQRVGDVEVSTAIVVPTPNLDKMRSVTAESQLIGAFLDWIANHAGYVLCEMNANDDYYPVRKPINTLLAEYFEIDEAACERERLALLEAIRR